MNPANMTRCEVCHYHYRFAEGTRTWHIHLLLYSLVLLQIIVFFGLAIGLGQVVKATNIVEAVDWGRLSFMKPDTARGWFFMGICCNFFLVGLAATLYVVISAIEARCNKRRARPKRKKDSPWSNSARSARQSASDCCSDCCYGMDTNCLIYCHLYSPNYSCCYCCEACCGLCDSGCDNCADCCKSGGGSGNCCDCGGCGCNDFCGGNDNPFVVVLLFAFAFLLAVLLVIGMLVLFWAVLVNTFYGIWLYQSYMRELAAKRHKVLPYDAEKDVPYVQEKKVEGVQTNPSVSGPSAAPKDLEAPDQQVMPTAPASNVLPGGQPEEQPEGTKHVEAAGPPGQVESSTM